MKVLKGTYRGGHIELSEPAPVEGTAEVEVIFLDEGDRRWEEILQDTSPRPALDQAAKKALAELEAGDTTPLDLDKS